MWHNRRNRFYGSESTVLYAGVVGKTGTDFLGAFLFETPFAVMRGFIWMLLPLTIILYLVLAFKANRHYERIAK